eukprot:TRINITY_DN75755_c0_g1_i1.p1 TRINITY_DN75755_c0_g1~~TRINITY_DN75755_c0_g1_i1.p1  ORF type:complete len:238 (-),score=5.39 TRINITY_DN75755_c0_g1_i1:439-1152(-)
MNQSFTNSFKLRTNLPRQNLQSTPGNAMCQQTNYILRSKYIVTKELKQNTPYAWPVGTKRPDGSDEADIDHGWVTIRVEEEVRAPERCPSPDHDDDEPLPSRSRAWTAPDNAPRRDRPRQPERRQPPAQRRRKTFPCGDGNQPVCLDWIQGLCKTKRWKCKFAHPPLESILPADSEDVCPVFALTGYCAFGDECRRGKHPTNYAKQPVCQPIPKEKIPARPRRGLRTPRTVRGGQRR